MGIKLISSNKKLLISKTEMITEKEAREGFGFWRLFETIKKVTIYDRISFEEWLMKFNLRII